MVDFAFNSIIEALNDSLDRLCMDYVDVYFAHKSDPSVPMEEVRFISSSLDYVLNSYDTLTSMCTGRSFAPSITASSRGRLITGVPLSGRHWR